MDEDEGPRAETEREAERKAEESQGRIDEGQQGVILLTAL
jgi:hypothetical protein